MNSVPSLKGAGSRDKHIIPTILKVHEISQRTSFFYWMRIIIELFEELYDIAPLHFTKCFNHKVWSLLLDNCAATMQSFYFHSFNIKMDDGNVTIDHICVH